MSVTLRDINQDNFRSVIKLSVTEDQRQFVADNTYSIAESKFYPSYVPKAIYIDDSPVGFLMYEDMKHEGREGEVEIFRLMIDQSFQKQGIGRKAMEVAIKEITKDPTIKKIRICYVPNNPLARDFYCSLGFVETGIEDDGEMRAELNF